MKHGDQAKAKSAKSIKASDSKKSGGKEVVVAKVRKEAGAESSSKAKAGSAKESGRKEAAVKTVPEKTAAPKAGGNGKPKVRDTSHPDSPGFNNPIVANAFKRAVKKFPTAFRKLTD
jgi:hypothetical protein